MRANPTKPDSWVSQRSWGDYRANAVCFMAAEPGEDWEQVIKTETTFVLPEGPGTRDFTA